MAGARGILGFGRREVAIGLALVPLATCFPTRPAKDVPFVPARKAVKLSAVDPGRLVEISTLDPSIKLDLRYATANNFTGKVLYPEPRAFLTAAAAEALLRAHDRARKQGYGFTIFDAYRPWSVTRALWNATAKAKRNYVANPKRGSRHNRGCAIDLTLHDLQSGQPAEMPTEFDNFTRKAHRDYMGASRAAIDNRARLQEYMDAERFIGISNEWWHFDFADWQQYPVMDVPFDRIV